MGKVDIHKKICEELNALYARKNADYGDSFGKSFKEYGLTMACIRLEDKLNRIKALRNKDAQVADESITDTLMDLANYSIMTLVEMRHPVTKFVDALRTMTQDTSSASCEKGEHDPNCKANHSCCQCNTCAKDSIDCCRTGNHLDHMCPMKDCPDYVPEEV